MKIEFVVGKEGRMHIIHPIYVFAKLEITRPYNYKQSMLPLYNEIISIILIERKWCRQHFQNLIKNKEQKTS